jgi:4-amino-4-deoxy-L-arabinose transferase-like glycosyltransferase
MGIYVSLFVRVLGDFEATIRIPLILMSLVGISLFYQLASQLYGRRVGTMATFFFALTPCVIYFSRNANWEVGSNLLSTGLILSYLNWLRRHQRKHLVLAYVFAFCGLWWMNDMGFLLLVLFGYSLIFGNRQEKLHTLGMGLVGLFSLGTWFFFTSSGFDKDALDAIWRQYQLKTSDTAGGQGVAESFTILDYGRVFALRLAYGISPFMVGFSLLGGYHLYRQARARSLPREAYLVFVMLISAAIHDIFWSNSTYLHDYRMLYIFVTPLSLLAGYGMGSIWMHSSFLPQTRPQRLAGGGVLGHAMLSLAVSIFLINFSNTAIPWMAEQVKTLTSPDERTVTNLVYRGPHVSYYADRSVTFDFDYDPDAVGEGLREGKYDFFFYCRKINDPEIPPIIEGVDVQPIEVFGPDRGSVVCYGMRLAESQ